MQLRYLAFILFVLAFTACDDEQLLPAIAEVAAPTDLSLKVVMDTETPGLVSLTPGGRGVTLFTLDYGDGSDLAELQVGEATVHQYAPGTYTLTLTGMGINGKIETFTRELIVAAFPPRNMVVSISPTAGNSLAIDVSATAEYASGFAAYFGEANDESPTMIGLEETVTYAYTAPGDYEVRVVALSEGTETDLEYSQTVTISDGSVAITLPLDFENTVTNYEWGDFGGASASVVDNPDVSAANGSARVVQLNKSSGSEVWAGAFIALDAPVDFSASDKIYVNVWSPRAGVPLILKLEDADDADINVEASANTSVAGAWELIEFDFSASGDLTVDYHKVVIFFDFGTNGMGEDFYFDDISLDGTTGGGGGGDDGGIALPLDFQDATADYVFTGFGGAEAEVVDNPDASGVNTSSRVAALTKSAGETWAGVFIDLDEPIDFNGDETVQLKVWSPVPNAPIVLKIENPDNGDENREMTVMTTTTNAWEEIEFDLAGIGALSNIRRVVLFANFGTNGTGEVYYFDDISLDGSGGGGGGGGGNAIGLPLDFQSTDANYAFTGFGGANAVVLDNPDASGLNTSSRVAGLTKDEGSEVWAGVFINLDEPLDFSGGQTFTLKVWSPAAGAQILFKLENPDNGDENVEVMVPTTVAGGWEELTFDMAGVEAFSNISRIVIFGGFGTPGTGETYYFDDIQFQ